MSKKSRINRKEKRLITKKLIKNRDGKCDFENTSDKGSHRFRTLNRERSKLFEKHFGAEK